MSETKTVAGSIEVVDPADMILILGYYANLPRYHVDTIYGKNGKVYVDISPAGRSAFEPPDVTTYLMERVEVDSEECIRFTEIAWHDGAKTYEAGEEPD